MIDVCRKIRKIRVGMQGFRGKQPLFQKKIVSLPTDVGDLLLARHSIAHKSI